jgi:hypothetical protein
MRCVRDHAWIQEKFDIAVGDNDHAQRPSGAQPLRQIKIRNLGGGKKPACRTRN